ncbi:MarR family winged helix-turn-helix transcriptional regulator [Flavisphingomonas formosensis]|uniref:MarR family winged helix-turn-helix transcriptional regulator n=1 Tax=Flavisphingomonas formosensis TaxID=861534 RepID=UPI0012FB4599|nr:MarR family winged helix-turn-helix transcriptional regulator [Sphingomonas formosensis]
MPFDRPGALPPLDLPALDAPKLDFDAFVPFTLIAIANRIARSASRAYLGQFGIGLNEWRLMAYLRVHPGITANQICDASELDKAAVSRSLRQLELRKLVAVGRGAGDPRGRALRLTAAGDTLHDRLVRVALARETMLLAGFSAEEQAQLRSFLSRLRTNARLLRDGGELEDV